MDLSQEIENYIKESIDDTLGLQVSSQTLQLKLRASEDARRRLHDQYTLLFEKSRQKDELIDRVKTEASMNALAVKKFVEENQRLAGECANLVSQCKKLERECSLYDNDREALMDFGNEADERAKEAEIRANRLEEEFLKLSEELKLYKHENEEARRFDSSAERTDVEGFLLESLLATLVSKDEIEYGHALLEANSEHEPCQKLLQAWESLRPSTQKVLSLAAKVNTLQKEKELLRTNLAKAEEEVELLSGENCILDEENKRLLRHHHREWNIDGSDGKHTKNTSAKRSKGKSSPKVSSPIEMKLDFKEVDSVRQPLSPLRHNSPDGRRMHKK